jgi:hypothetical protein
MFFRPLLQLFKTSDLFSRETIERIQRLVKALLKIVHRKTRLTSLRTCGKIEWKYIKYVVKSNDAAVAAAVFSEFVINSDEPGLITQEKVNELFVLAGNKRFEMARFMSSKRQAIKERIVADLEKSAKLGIDGG